MHGGRRGGARTTAAWLAVGALIGLGAAGCQRTQGQATGAVDCGAGERVVVVGSALCVFAPGLRFDGCPVALPAAVADAEGWRFCLAEATEPAPRLLAAARAEAQADDPGAEDRDAAPPLTGNVDGGPPRAPRDLGPPFDGEPPDGFEWPDLDPDRIVPDAGCGGC